MREGHSSHTTVFTVTGAAEEIGKTRQTVASWIAAGLVTPSARIDGQPALSEADLAKLRELAKERDTARLALRLPKVSSSGA
jgi:hypothetical protein